MNKLILFLILIITPFNAWCGDLSYADKIHFIDTIRLELLDLECNIPTSLVLAQAILESDWGRSRYSKDNNNLFGLEEYKKGKWSPIKFKTKKDSLIEYIRLLNNGSYFKEFRVLNHLSDNSHTLTYGLKSYSILGDEYIRRVQEVIKIENLKQYD